MNANHTTYFDSIKKGVQEFFVEREGLTGHTTGRFNDLKNPSSVVLFFCIQTKTELEEIRELLKTAEEKMKSVVAYVFSNSHSRVDLITNKSIFFIDLNDFTLWAKKKPDLEQRLNKDHFELAISFAPSPRPVCKKLISEIRAGFKVGIGFEGSEKLYDLSFGLQSEKMPFGTYLDQVLHYLSALNIKTEKQR